jgi:hypothetical protein
MPFIAKMPFLAFRIRKEEKKRLSTSGKGLLCRFFRENSRGTMRAMGRACSSPSKERHAYCKGGSKIMRHTKRNRGSATLLVVAGVALLALGAGGTWFLMDERSEGFREEMRNAQSWMRESLKDAEKEMEKAREDLRNLGADFSRKKEEWQRLLKEKTDEAGVMMEDLRKKLGEATKKGEEVREELQREYEEKLEALKKDFSQRFTEGKEEMERRLTEQRQEFLKEKEALEGRFMEEKESLKHEASRILEEARKEMKEMLRQKEEELQDLRNKLEQKDTPEEVSP